MTNTEQHKLEVEQLTDQLRHDAANVRVAYQRLRADGDDAWTRYVTEVDTTLQQMERDLEAERAALAVQRADQTAELRDALHEVLDRVHGALDDLRVQEALLEMDARDRFGSLLATGQHALHELRGKVRQTIDVVASSSSPR